MNAVIYNELPQENTISTWLFLCTCVAQRCHCNAKFKPDILCIIGHPCNHPSPKPPISKLTIQFIEFIYCNDRSVVEALDKKTTKYQLLINNITTRE